MLSWSKTATLVLKTSSSRIAVSAARLRVVDLIRARTSSRKKSMKTGVNVSAPSEWPANHLANEVPKSAFMAIAAIDAPPTPLTTGATIPVVSTKPPSHRIDSSGRSGIRICRSKVAAMTASQRLMIASGTAASTPNPNRAVTAAPAIPQLSRCAGQALLRSVASLAMSSAVATQRNATPPSKRVVETVAAATTK